MMKLCFKNKRNWGAIVVVDKPQIIGIYFLTRKGDLLTKFPREKRRCIRTQMEKMNYLKEQDSIDNESKVENQSKQENDHSDLIKNKAFQPNCQYKQSADNQLVNDPKFPEKDDLNNRETFMKNNKNLNIEENDITKQNSPHSNISFPKDLLFDLKTDYEQDYYDELDDFFDFGN